MNWTAILYAIAVLGGLGVIFGAVLSFADKKFAVPVDEKVEKIRQALAGANCGACGFPGCDGYANAVAKGEAPINACTPGGTKTLSAISEIMGIKADSLEPRVARVLCQGKNGVAKERYEYTGKKSCHIASQIAGGPTQCAYGCVGLGDCVSVCKFDALKIVDGLATIDENKCTACGMCEKACPRNLIVVLPQSASVRVSCKSKAPAKEAKDACSNACIGCKRCEKACQFDAIHVNSGLASIDYDKCTKCGECLKVCPDQCIVIN